MRLAISSLLVALAAFAGFAAASPMPTPTLAQREPLPKITVPCPVMVPNCPQPGA